MVEFSGKMQKILQRDEGYKKVYFYVKSQSENHIGVLNYIYIRGRFKFMFGYVKPYKPELKLKSIHRYRSLYCNLCYALRKNYGQIYGLALSYDVTFLLTVLNALDTEKTHLHFRCPTNPAKIFDTDISQSALNYAAFINYYLIYLKIEDDILDENSILKKVLKRILEKNKKYVNQLRLYDRIADDLKNRMKLLHDAECNGNDFDELTNSFGEFFSTIFSDYLNDIGHEVSGDFLRLMFNLGKWIYIMDAYDDYQSDKKKGEFNLLDTLRFLEDVPPTKQIHDRIQAINSIILIKMRECVEKIQVKEDKDIIENIVIFGCEQQYSLILKKYHNSI